MTGLGRYFQRTFMDDCYWHSNAVMQLVSLQFVGLIFTATLPDFAHCSLASA